MGQLKLPLGFRKRIIHAGPYHRKPVECYGIKLAHEVRGHAHRVVPIKDFGVPKDPYDMEESIRFALERVVNDFPVYVGCLGGLGRTGMFLAILCKALGVRNPIQYVRDNFNSHAVETTEQENYVLDFDLCRLEGVVAKAKRAAKVRDIFRLVGYDYFYDPVD